MTDLTISYPSNKFFNPEAQNSYFNVANTENDVKYQN